MEKQSNCAQMENVPKKKGNILYKITSSDLKLYEQRSVFFSKPVLVAYYEDNYDQITPGKRIQYFKEPGMSQYPMDLNDGYETFCRLRPSLFSKRIGLSLKHVMLGKDFPRNDAVDDVERTIVYTRRGTLSHIMESTYLKNGNNWKVRISRFNGNIYMALEEFYEPEGQIEKVNSHHKQLEKLLFSESPTESPKNDEPCDENISFIGVHRSTLGKYDITYAGDIQGIIAEEKFNDFDDLDALNKCRFVLTKQIWQKLQNNDAKYLPYWLNCYLANVHDLYVAHKNPFGVVEKPIEHKIVSDLPKKRYWKPKICTAVLHDFLQRVEKLMSNSNINCLNTVYLFSYEFEGRSISYEIFNGKTDKTFISQEYMDYCKNNMP